MISYSQYSRANSFLSQMARKFTKSLHIVGIRVCSASLVTVSHGPFFTNDPFVCRHCDDGTRTDCICWLGNR